MKKIGIIFLVSVALLTSCNSIDEDITGESISNSSVQTEELKINLSNTDYPLYLNRTKINDYHDAFEEDISSVKNLSYSHLFFNDCIFEELPEFNLTSIYVRNYGSITVDDSILAIEKQIEDNGLKDKVDIKSELRDASSQYPYDSNGEYVKVYDKYPEFDSGKGFFINCEDFYIQMGAYSIYGMSTGEISKQLGLDSPAFEDAFGIFTEDVEPIRTDLVKNISNEKYNLSCGNVTVGEVSETIKKYFDAGIPQKGPEGFEYEVNSVKIFDFDGLCCFEYKLIGKYNNIPFSSLPCSHIRHPDSYAYELDDAVVYSIDGKVNAFNGNFLASDFVSISGEQDSIISLSEATNILDKYYGAEVKLNISHVSFEYCTICSTEDENQKTVYPCWVFEGVNENDGRTIRSYVSSLTGDVFYFSYMINGEK